MEISGVIECQEGLESPPAQQPDRAGWPAGVEPDDPPPPRGRPWAKGHSGNPAGRPPKRAHVGTNVARSLINRKTVQLTRKQIDLALLGDRTMLRLCHQSLAPPRHEAPIALRLPPIDNRADVRIAMKAVADAAMNGTMTSTQRLRLLRTLPEVYCPL